MSYAFVMKLETALFLATSLPPGCAPKSAPGRVSFTSVRLIETTSKAGGCANGAAPANRPATSTTSALLNFSTFPLLLALPQKNVAANRPQLDLGPAAIRGPDLRAVHLDSKGLLPLPLW